MAHAKNRRKTRRHPDAIADVARIVAVACAPLSLLVAVILREPVGIVASVVFVAIAANVNVSSVAGRLRP